MNEINLFSIKHPDSDSLLQKQKNGAEQYVNNVLHLFTHRTPTNSHLRHKTHYHTQACPCEKFQIFSHVERKGEEDPGRAAIIASAFHDLFTHSTPFPKIMFLKPE